MGTRSADQQTGPTLLATDLDGTLIPLDGEPQNRQDLQTLAALLERLGVALIYVTGRHLESVERAIDEHQMPRPDWLICDVGTSIYQHCDGEHFQLLEAYAQHEDEIIASCPLSELRGRLAAVEGLRLQEDEKQGRFKLSYYVNAEHRQDIVDAVQRRLDGEQLPYSIVASVDPFTGDGLIDLLPSQVSKAHALRWWTQQQGCDPHCLVFAGDSGNDLAALTAGFRAIVVGNADREVAQQVQEHHRRAGWSDRLYLAKRSATSGVLEGCRWFGLVPPEGSSV
jgi:sucrose-6F-phosphate phosphohydrolase